MDARGNCSAGSSDVIRLLPGRQLSGRLSTRLAAARLRLLRLLLLLQARCCFTRPVARSVIPSRFSGLSLFVPSHDVVSTGPLTDDRVSFSVDRSLSPCDRPTDQPPPVELTFPPAGEARCVVFRRRRPTAFSHVRLYSGDRYRPVVCSSLYVNSCPPCTAYTAECSSLADCLDSGRNEQLELSASASPQWKRASQR